jgi:hypothetical protein
MESSCYGQAGSPGGFMKSSVIQYELYSLPIWNQSWVMLHQENGTASSTDDSSCLKHSLSQFSEQVVSAYSIVPCVVHCTTHRMCCVLVLSRRAFVSCGMWQDFGSADAA